MTSQSVAKYTTNCSVGEVGNNGKTNRFIDKLTCPHFEVSRLVTMINSYNEINWLHSSAVKMFNYGSEVPEFESGQGCYVFCTFSFSFSFSICLFLVRFLLLIFF